MNSGIGMLHFCPFSYSMAKSETVGLNCGALRKECLEAVRQWPGCETIAGIQIIRENSPGGFSVRVTLYAQANQKIAERLGAFSGRSDGSFI